MGENIHFHYRDLRIEFSVDEFKELVTLFDEYKEMILIDATMDSKPVGTVTLLKPKFATVI